MQTFCIAQRLSVICAVVNVAQASRRSQAGVEHATLAAPRTSAFRYNKAGGPLSRNEAPCHGTNQANKRAGGGYVVAIVFAGRKNLMSLLVQYLDLLIQRCQLDEVHMWDRTRNDADAMWLQELSKKPRYELFPTRGSWDPPYRFYTSWASPRFEPKLAGATANSTVLLKIDDDIVYLDPSRFAAYVGYIRDHKDKFLVHANVVNNGVAAYYEGQHVAAITRRHPELKEYPIEDHVPGYYGAVVKDTNVSSDLHRLFLENRSRFHWEQPEQDNCVVYGMWDPQERDLGEVAVEGQGRFSINFFGTRWADWDTVYSLLEKAGDSEDDEKQLTVVASESGLQECMYTPFNVVHWGFKTQHNPDDLLASYWKLLNVTVSGNDSDQPLV